MIWVDWELAVGSSKPQEELMTLTRRPGVGKSVEGLVGGGDGGVT